MNSATTNGICIRVKPTYQAAYSRPVQDQYVFSYRVFIENQSPDAVQLLRRYWIITDSLGRMEEVQGEGVIGEQPIILPGEVHSYDSFCPLSTPFGTMEGTYLMQNRTNFSTFHAKIPRFKLESLVGLN
ncbi:MAG: Co2+/Mg2+ efflux protein ApaG [Bacteroidetes bacterium]|nr:MAG: Co2+/Mg2+ efflux protein ApaG [Bacteroidota bacterium]